MIDSKKKAKKRKNSAFLIFFGLVFIVLDIIFGVRLVKAEYGLAVLIAGICGLLLLFIGALIAKPVWKERKQIKNLKKNDTFVLADYTNTIETECENPKWKPDKADVPKWIKQYTCSFTYMHGDTSYNFSKTYEKQKKIPFKEGDCARIFVDLNNPDVYLVVDKAMKRPKEKKD